MSAKAVFLDKDGTLVEDVPYNVDPDRMRLMRGAESLTQLQACGFALYVVSNQPGVALGKFPESSLSAVERRLRELLGTFGVSFRTFLYCPHAPQAACACRKPADGLLRRAALENGLALEASWMVGDILDDVEAGRRAGCRTALILNGNETEWRQGEARVPHVVAADLADAAALILQEARP
jgi:D-glycero-D-manno-heptose 1,7-bisphosphate phosphatase